MSVHFICLINQLYKQAVILAEDYKQHRDMFKALQTKIKVVLQAITEIYSMPKSIDFATLYVKIANIMEILNNFNIELEMVTNDIKNGIIESRHAKPWAIEYVVVAACVCAVSFFLASPLGRGLICASAIGVIAYSTQSFSSLANTNEELNRLQKDTRKLSVKLAKHQAQLQVKLALVKGKLNHSMPGRYALRIHQTRNSLNTGPDFKDCLLSPP